MAASWGTIGERPTAEAKARREGFVVGMGAAKAPLPTVGGLWCSDEKLADCLHLLVRADGSQDVELSACSACWSVVGVSVFEWFSAGCEMGCAVEWRSASELPEVRLPGSPPIPEAYGFAWVLLKTGEVDLAYLTVLGHAYVFQTAETVGDREGLSIEYLSEVLAWAPLVYPDPPEAFPASPSF